MRPDMGLFYKALISKADGPTKLKAAGLAVKAADTGRILMLQRSFADLKDPARGKWELPGGHIDDGEDARDAAVREWEEETGQKLPPGQHAGSWDSPNGIYRGHVYVVPSEDHVPVGALRTGKVKNPDDPDHSEALAWHEQKHLPHNPAVRKEMRNSTDWDVLAGKHKETAQQWNTSSVGPSKSQSPLHHGPQGPSTPEAPGNTPSEQFPESFVTVNPADGGKSKQLKVLVADSPARRTIGLQNTPDLAGSEYDGLLMKWPSEAIASLHNNNVPHPVGATFFDSRGMYRDHFLMNANDPTSKTARSSHKYALEVHADDMDKFGLGPGSSMDMGEDRNGTIQMS